MRRRLLQVTVLVWVTLFFSGCGWTNSTITQSQSYKLYPVHQATIVEAKEVLIEDDGKGALIGGTIGATAGYFIGHAISAGAASEVLGALGGAVGGMYAGHEFNRHIGQQLLIQLRQGGTYLIIVKGQRYFRGQQIKVAVKNGVIATILPVEA